MNRKNFKDEADNPDRWLVSYADFMTLMFAFFVMLYSISSVQEKKLQELSQSVGAALGLAPLNKSQPTPPLPDPGAIIETLNPSPPIAIDPIQLVPMPAPIEQMNLTSIMRHDHTQQQDDTQNSLIHQQQVMKQMVQQLEQNLSSLIDQGKIHINQSNWGISIEINASLLFAPAEIKLNQESRQTLQSIADVLKQQPYAIRVEGHTDDKPIRTPTVPSNWELSSARATGVVRLLNTLGIESKRLSAIGYADNRPLADNQSAEGRLRNRRVQMMIYVDDNHSANGPSPVAEQSSITPPRTTGGTEDVDIFKAIIRNCTIGSI